METFFLLFAFVCRDLGCHKGVLAVLTLPDCLSIHSYKDLQAFTLKTGTPPFWGPVPRGLSSRGFSPDIFGTLSRPHSLFSSPIGPDVPRLLPGRHKARMATGKPKSYQDQSMALTKKEALLQAAKDLFGECGYNETTFKKIAERAGVAMGLMTHHFGNKEKLFLACGLEVLENFLGKLRETTAQSPNGMAAILDYCKAYLDFSIDPSTNWLVLVRCSPYSDMKTTADRDIMNEKFLEIHGVLIDAIKRGLDDGSIVKVEPVQTATIIVSLMVGVNRTRVLTPYAPDGFYEQALEFVKRAITPVPGQAS